MGAQLFFSRIVLEVPIRQGRRMARQLLLQLEGGGMNQLGRAQAVQLLPHRIGVIDLRGSEFPGGYIGVGNANPARLDHDRGQVVIDVAGQQAGFQDCSRRHHPYHLSGEQPANWPIADLLADGNVVALLDQPGQIRLGRMEWNSGHRDPHAFGNIAGGQHDLQFLRRDLGIVVEGLIEVAQSEEQNGVGILALDFKILLPNRGQAHAYAFYFDHFECL